ncbi:hypothetical protein JTE90_017219 [Oedothorax gibbosus]|uniref:ABC transporter domain-containing protein n=1 Tax=Oedothorax gibbosus TaxID=931172 RepID=A0AAV6VFG5_9ARAC|nr:hypothetical protein JTE90_017219 [Oedothorax gibbosus]
MQNRSPTISFSPLLPLELSSDIDKEDILHFKAHWDRGFFLRFRKPPPKMGTTSGLWQFIILLYKGLLLRKRHYIVTFFEIVIPIFIASVPAIIQSEMSSSEMTVSDLYDRSTSLWENETTYEPFDPFISKMDKNYALEFVYTPPNPTSEKLVNEAIKMFRRRAEYKGTITKKSALSENDLEMYCLYKQRVNSTLIMIGTVFNNFGKTLPESLDYKIRYGGGDFGENFFTQQKYRVNGPSNTNVYNSTFFLSWQAAVEQSFIQEKMAEKGKNVDYKVWMQRFPYPKHRNAANVFTVINLIPWVIGYGYLIFIMNIVRRVIEEKTNKSKELMKMMGMTDCIYWTSTFFNYFFVAIITMLVTTIIYKAPLKNSFVFVKNMDFMLLFFLLTLFMACLILFCMAFSIFFTKNVVAVVALIMAHILSFTLLMSNYFLLSVEVNYLPLAFIAKLGICLLPSGSLLTMFTIISNYESTGEGAQWYNLTEYSYIPDMNMLTVIIMMIVSCIVYTVIIWYFDAVWPWQPGVPKPFYFPFTKSYWCGATAKEVDHLLLANQNDNSADFFEEEPSGATPGVVIRNLSKDFRTGFHTKQAVKNVSLNIYQGQITALLGHNGAGKTTTINILTGMYTPTSGSAAINGLDILSDTIKARRGLGVCPQDNVLYDTLTVEEHLKIYAALKGVSFRNLTEEASKVLGILKLEDKRHELVKSLSGGMKRKLSLGIAVVGGSKVLFLDEPTSGMDVEARRSVWDALLDIRHDRTIILTTHYMEEADILGDRIAIMAEGEVQCCGSPMFLKHKFGTGYHLHVVKGTNFDVKGLTKILEKYIPEVSVGNELDQEIAFSLASDSTTEFGVMFEEVEKHKDELGVQSFGITITTMEDVFLNVSNISDMKYKLQGGNNQPNGSNVEFEDVYGNSGHTKKERDPFNQFFGLLLKRFHYSKRHYSIILSQLILPFILICWCLNAINGGTSTYKTTFEPLKLDIASEYGPTEGFYFSQNEKYSGMAGVFKDVLKSNRVTVREVPDPTRYVLQYGLDDLSKYLKVGPLMGPRRNLNLMPGQR